MKGTVEHSLQAGTGLHLGHAGGPSSQRHDELVQRFVCQDGLMASRRHCDRGAAGPRVVFRLASGSERITTFRRGRRDDRQFVCRANGCSGHSASSGSSQSAPRSGKTIANTAASKQATVSALADFADLSLERECLTSAVAFKSAWDRLALLERVESQLFGRSRTVATHNAHEPPTRDRRSLGPHPTYRQPLQFDPNPRPRYCSPCLPASSEPRPQRVSPSAVSASAADCPQQPATWPE